MLTQMLLYYLDTVKYLRIREPMKILLEANPLIKHIIGCLIFVNDKYSTKRATVVEGAVAANSTVMNLRVCMTMIGQY